jgi:hypothetical protein
MGLFSCYCEMGVETPGSFVLLRSGRKRRPKSGFPPENNLRQEDVSLLVCFFLAVTYNGTMQFRVPQNIDMEDRIVGPLTAIQFGIMVIGGGTAFLVFTSTSIPSPLNSIFGSFLALLTLVLSIGKFNDQPMYRVGGSIVGFIIKPKVRIWHKDSSEVKLIKPVHQSLSQERNSIVKKVTKDDISRLALVLDSRGNSGVVPKIKAEDPK